MPSGSSSTSPFLVLALGIVSTGGILYLHDLGDQKVDWTERAGQHQLAREWHEAYDAATRALQDNPEDHQLLNLRSMAAEQLRMPSRALEDIERALEVEPNNARYTTRKVGLLVKENSYDAALEFVDAKVEASPRNPGAILQAVQVRLSNLDWVEQKALAILERNHPQVLYLRSRLHEMYRSPTPQSIAYKLLVEPLPIGVTRTKLEEYLQLSWKLVREADSLLDNERIYVNRTDGTLHRIRVDVRLGRLLRAKEELQTLLLGQTSPRTRREGLELLADVLGELGADAGRAHCFAELTQLYARPDGSIPTERVADLLEAQYFEADQVPALRPDWIERADKQVASQAADMRTLGYRGLAALRWDGSREAIEGTAIPNLRRVLNALERSRKVDPSILVPERAFRLLTGLLDAYKKSSNPAAGLPVANTLVSIAPNDPAVLTERASMLITIDRAAQASDDLLAALRTPDHDPTLFDRWLETGARRLDPLGRTPRKIASLAARQYQRKLEEYNRQISDEAIAGAHRRKRLESFDRLGRYERTLSRDPMIAWLMADEYGRIGQVDLSRQFLTKARTAEPDVAEFRLRLGQVLLDQGRTEAAIRQFEHVLERDPTHFMSAWYACQALSLIGDVEDRREIRARSMIADPATSGLKFGIDAALEAGDVPRARQMLAPHDATKDPELAQLYARTFLEVGNYAACRAVLIAARRNTPDSPEIARLLILANALLDETESFDQEVEAFAQLPRLLPAGEIFDLIDRLEAVGLFAQAGRVATLTADRYTERTHFRLLGRAALAHFRAGDPKPLYALRLDPEAGDELPDDAIRAAFGLALRIDGVDQAAAYLRAACDSNKRTFADLAAAAALSLTAHKTDALRHFTRYSDAHQETPVPANEAAVYSVVRSRLGMNSVRVAMPPGVEQEQKWIQSLRGSAKAAEARDPNLLYILMYLYAFAGPQFDDETLAVARELGAVSWDAATASRRIAEVLNRREGPSAAASNLLVRYRKSLDDLPTFEMLGAMLRETDPTGEVLTLLANVGTPRFPGQPFPQILAAEAAARDGNPRQALALIDDLGTSGERTQTAAALARIGALGDADVSREVASRLGAMLARDEAARDFLIKRYRDRSLAEEAVEVLGPLVADDPTFYEGAATLADALTATQQTESLQRLIVSIAAAITPDPSAASAADTIARVGRTALRSNLNHESDELLATAVLAAPSHITLRLLHIDVLQALGRAADVIDELALLCLLAPRDPDLIFNYGEALLAERTDQADLIADRIPTLQELAPDDPRLHALQGRLAFLNDDLPTAVSELLAATEGAPERDDYRYLYGLYAFLDGRVDVALTAFKELPKDFPMARRTEWVERVARGSAKGGEEGDE